MNHGVNEWIFFIGLGQVSDINTYTLGSAFMVLYDQKTSSVVPLLKYYYFKQALSAFDVGCVFRKCVSATEGDMFSVGIQNPAINAAAAYNPDGSWALNIVNDTGIAGSPAYAKNLYYAATNYNVTLKVEELTNTPSMDFTIYRSSANSHLVNAGTLTLAYGVGTLSLAPKELVSLRSASTPAAIPEVPNGLSASTYNAPVTLNWNNTVKATNWNVKRATTSGGPYMTIATTTTTRYGDTTALNGTVYYYVVSAVNSVGESANSSEVLSSPTPFPWSNVDIGTVGLAGGCTVSDGGVFATSGAGANLGNVSDSFNFTYRTMAGNGTLIAHVSKAASANSQVGIMMSDTLGTAPKAAFLIFNFNGAWFQAMMCARTTAGTWGQWAGSKVTNVPAWFKLVRSGNTFTGYASADGLTWATVSSATISMANTIDVGLVNCSGSTSSLNKGIFDNVAAPCATPTGLTGVINANSSSIILGWTACLGATSYNVKRSTASGGPFIAIGSVPSPSLNYTDTTIVNGTNYYYVVSAVNEMGESPNSTNAIPQSVSSVPSGLTATAMNVNQVRLTWTNILTNLYYTGNLTAPASWVLVTNRTILSNGQWTVTVPSGTNGCGFYRLQQ